MAESLVPRANLLPRVKPGRLPALALAMARSGLALMLYGPPGTGKTSLFQAMGADPGLLAWATQQCGRPLEVLPVVTISAPELNVEDLLGVPTVEDLVRRLPDGSDRKFRVTRWALPAMLDPTAPFILFIDEPNRCEPAIRNALFQLVTFRATTGGFALPKGSIVCMAGNRLEDRAGVRSLDTAFSNRCGHFELVVDHEAWLDWAAAQPGFSVSVRAYLARHPEQLCRFDPASGAPQQPTPRTWGGLGSAFEGTPEDLRETLIQGLVGYEQTQFFTAFLACADALPDLAQVLRDPDAVPLPGPEELDRAWIFATGVADLLGHRELPEGTGPDALGRALGQVLGRLGERGFEEVVTFSVRTAYRRLGKLAGAEQEVLRRRLLGLITTLATAPAFIRFVAELRGAPAV